MAALDSLLTAFPIPTLVVIGVVVFLGSRKRGDDDAKTVRQVAIAAACYLFAFVVLSWADDSSTSLWLLVGALVIVGVAALFRIGQARTHRGSVASQTRDAPPPP